MSGTSKIAAERNSKAVIDLVMKPGNDICADCKTRNPRWSSHNLGIFICVNCASIHRKIGTHISKVKSLTLDSWTKEQVENMRQIGNIKSNQIYNPDEVRNPPPTNMVDSERDSELEKFIRDKYEFKKFVSRSAIVAAHLGPSRSAASVKALPTSSPQRSQTAPLGNPTASSTRPLTSSQTLPQIPSTATQPSTFQHSLPNRSATQPPFAFQQQQQVQQVQQPASGVWSDLAALQSPARNSSLPLQYQTSQPLAFPNHNPFPTAGTTPFGNGMGLSPGANATGVSPNLSVGGGMGMGLGISSGMGMNNMGSSPFQTQPQMQMQAQPASFGAPNAFSSAGTGAGNPFAQMLAAQSHVQGQVQIQQPFQSQPFTPQQNPFPQPTPTFLQQQPTSFQPQPTAFAPSPQPFAPQSQANPFYTAGQPMLAQSQTPFRTTPSPYGGMGVGTQFQPQQSQPQQMFAAQGMQQQSPMPMQGTNPFTGWMQQAAPAQGGFTGQNGPWGSM